MQRETEKKRERRKGMREGEGIMGGGGWVSRKTHYFSIQLLRICQTRKTFYFLTKRKPTKI